MDAQPLLHQSPPPPPPPPPGSSRSPPSKPPPPYAPPTVLPLIQVDPPPLPAPALRLTESASTRSPASASSEQYKPPLPPPQEPLETAPPASSPGTEGKHVYTEAIRHGNADEERGEGATNVHSTASSSTALAPASGSSPNSIRNVESKITRSGGGFPTSSESVDRHEGALHKFLNLVLRRKDEALPVRNPAPSTFKRLIEIYKSSAIGFLPEDVIRIRIAVCGVAMYGMMALFSNTLDLVRNFSDNGKVAVMFSIGLFWVVGSVAVGFTMSGRTRPEHLLSQHGTRVCLLGITLLLLFNIALMLQQGFWREKGASINYGSAVVSILLPILAIVGLAGSSILSMLYDEIDRKLTQDIVQS